MTDSIAASNAAQSEFYRTHDRTIDAEPSDYDIAEELANRVLHNHGIHNDAWVRTIAQVRELLIEAVQLAWTDTP